MGDTLNPMSTPGIHLSYMLNSVLKVGAIAGFRAFCSGWGDFRKKWTLELGFSDCRHTTNEYSLFTRNIIVIVCCGLNVGATSRY